MTLLLDTHSWIWSLSAPDKLSPASRAMLADVANTVFVSVVSLWESAIKVSLGKLRLHQPLRELVRLSEDEFGYRLLPIEVDHLEALQRLDWAHRDPFDRLLVAQAQADGLSLMTADNMLTKESNRPGVSVPIVPA